MLNIKKLITKILGSHPSWTYVNDVYWWGNTWTVPDDGFIEVYAEPNASNWYLRISDSKVPDTGWSHRMAGADNVSVSQQFFVQKGAVLSTHSLSAVSMVRVYYYKFNTLGGVINHLKNAISNLYREGVAVC